MQYLIGSASELARCGRHGGSAPNGTPSSPSSSTTRASSTGSPRSGKRHDDLRRELPAGRNSPRRAAAGRALSVGRWLGACELSAGLVAGGRRGRADRLRACPHRSASLGGRPAPALPRERLAGPPGDACRACSARPAGRTGARRLLGQLVRTMRARGARARALLAAAPPDADGWSASTGATGSPGRERSSAATPGRFPNLRDAEGTVGNDYHLTGLPTTFVLDAHGRIRAVLRGPQDEGSLERALTSVAAS